MILSGVKNNNTGPRNEGSGDRSLSKKTWGFSTAIKPPVSRGLYAVQQEISPARSASCSSHTCPWLPSRPGRRAGLRRRGRAS